MKLLCIPGKNRPSGWRLFFALVVVLIATQAAVLAVLGNAWHIPDNNTDVDSDTTGVTNLVYMRNPRLEFALGAGTSTTLAFYQAVYKGGGDNENGSGKLWYRSVPAGGTPGTWVSAPLNFFSDEYNVSPHLSTGLEGNTQQLELRSQRRHPVLL